MAGVSETVEPVEFGCSLDRKQMAQVLLIRDKGNWPIWAFTLIGGGPIMVPDDQLPEGLALTETRARLAAWSGA